MSGTTTIYGMNYPTLVDTADITEVGTLAANVDTTLSDIDSSAAVKQRIRAVSAVNISISSLPTTIDGVTMAAGDLFLLAGNTTGSQNGLWTWTAAGSAATRPAGFTAGTGIAAVKPGHLVVGGMEGTANGGLWQNTNTSAITVGTTALTYVQVSGIGGSTTNVQVFTSSGTWTKPAGAKIVRGWLIGGGGGGGGARCGGSGALIVGGGAGAAGGYVPFEYEAADLPGTVTVTIGGSAAGGAGGIAAGGNGSDGTNGNPTTFGSILQANNGINGSGSLSGGSGGSGGNGANLFLGLNMEPNRYLAATVGNGGAGGSGAVGNQGGTGSAPLGVPLLGPGGGGGGGGISVTPAAFAGGNGELGNHQGNLGPTSGTGGTTAGGLGGTGGASTAHRGGSGGGGGGSSIVTSVSGGNGGPGGLYGGGGGGGGGALSGGTATGGTGGAGAQGICVVITQF